MFNFSSAQNISVKGRVISDNGAPISGVNIFVQHTTKGAITDSLGHYQLQLQKGNHQLQFNYIGYLQHLESLSIQGDSSVVNVPLVILQPSAQTLETVVIEGKPKMRIARQAGTLTVAVSNTNFEETRNVWEGLKRVPMLRVKNGGGVQILGKSAIVEINGIRTKMSGRNLENYLKSLNPNSVEKIELEPNPGAAYGSQVSAYINIVLKEGLNNYRLSLKTINGTRHKYFNTSGANFSLNLKKLRLYTNYNFSYTPIETESNLIQHIENSPLQHTDNFSKNLARTHSVTANLYLKIGKKDQLSVTNYFSNSNGNQEARNTRENYLRKFNNTNKNRRLQFAQVWKHKFSDSVSIKIGAYEVFKNGNTHNSAQVNTDTPQFQQVQADIPILIGFADYENTTTWGTTSAGLRYRDITVDNNNFNRIGNQHFSAPYHYTEKAISAYLSQRFSVGDYSSFSIGLRSESSIIDYTFTALNTTDSYSDSPRYTNLMYNAQYSWFTPSNNRLYNIAFRKMIQRPNYSALNPFLELSGDGTYNTGDTRLDPQLFYNLMFYTHKGDWTFYASTAYIKDLISNTYLLKNNSLTQNYQNFANTYMVAAGAEFNRDFFNNFWTVKAGVDLQYFYLDDDTFVMDKFTPALSFSFNNTLNITDTWHAQIDFSIGNTYQDGLFKHHGSANLDFLCKKN